MKIIKLKNKNLQIELLDIGFTFKQINFKNKNLLLEYEDVLNYENNNDIFLNSFVGPYAGRIEKMENQFKKHNLSFPKNNENFYIHGGEKKWSDIKFELHQIDDQTVIGFYKDEGDENFYEIKITLKLEKKKNEFKISYSIKAAKDSICNPTHHFYWLRNENKNIWEDKIKTIMNYIVFLDEQSLPSHKVKLDLKNIFKLQDIKNKIGSQIDIVNNGIDHPFAINNNDISYLSHRNTNLINFTSSGNNLVIYTYNYPSSNKMLNSNIHKHAAICFEFQNHPLSKKYNNHFKDIIINKYKTYNNFLIVEIK